ncbi:N-acetylglucosamine-6-phosphate deacetylase [Suttonella ornithocola]|uniref:N-acetylglucosamine-6-phosphate deacetylase n=1 Tax=Suttonella ornithocola TaxID=279832 RepID=A0A380MW92_9GAMM|nr:amidohydrolase family protein [Suttonella ornithocola]SUO95981.1 N-acetylglucosamine-6-phosphate deacetylase [Suttonella ornithocola]
MITYYRGAQLYDNGNLIEGFALAVENGKTIALLPETDIPKQVTVKTLNGGVLTPGFIETQANGGGGVLVNSDTSETGLSQIFSGHRQYGTVAMLPTFITDSKEKYHQAIKNIANAVKNNVPGIIGGHFEGPFLNPEKKGTHQIDYIRQPDKDDFAVYEQYSEYLQHSILSLAPEKVERGTIAAIKPFIPQINMAHSQATHEDIARAYGEGLTGLTHYYNAMRPLSGRDPGPLGSAAEFGLYVGIIPDGIHSHPYSLASAYRLIGKHHLMLVTDSMHTIGTSDIQEFDLMGIKVFVKEDRLVNEHDSLAGAHINQLQCLHNAIRYMHIDLRTALTMLIKTPATYVQRPDLARIAQRNIEEIIYLDKQLALRNWQ